MTGIFLCVPGRWETRILSSSSAVPTITATATRLWGICRAPTATPSAAPCARLRRRFPTATEKENLCFILPLRRYGEDDPRGEFGAQTKTRPPLGGYVGAETAVLREMGISYLNLREVFPAPETNAPSEYYADGLHPTDKGHALLADCIVNYLTDRGIV